MKYLHNPHAFIIIASLLMPIFTNASEEEDSVKTFFASLESVLRKDYHHCTGDSVEIPLKFLIAWKQQLDSIASSDEYSTLAKEFYKETRITPGDVRPCDILSWKKNRELQLQNIAKILEDQKKYEAREKKDSLYVLAELAKVSRNRYDFSGIPFGVPKKCLQLLAKKAGLRMIDEGNYFRSDSVNLGNLQVKVALYLDKDGNYSRYELESKTGSIDSLDSWVRLQADSLAAFIERKSGASPNHLYRIGRFDIVQGKLAIYKMWNLPEASIYVGLASFKYRYYAKAMVSSRDHKR